MKKVKKEGFTFFVDDREKKPWTFSERIKEVRKRLAIGDYQVKGYRKIICVERKGSVEDLFASLGRHRNRFFDRMTTMVDKFQFSYLVIEATPRDIWLGSRYTKVDPGAAIGSLISLMTMGIRVVFLGRAKRKNSIFVENLMIRTIYRWRNE